LAFEALKGIRVLVGDDTYIIGDYFSVIPNSEAEPRIYTWKELTSLSELKREFTLKFGDNQFKISKKILGDNEHILYMRALLEGVIANFPEVEYHHQRRILPPKRIYRNCDTPADAYIARGVYNEKEISFSNVILAQIRYGKVFFVIFFVVACAMLFLLYREVGGIKANWFYFLPISIFSGLAAAMFGYLAMSIISKHVYATLLTLDPALVMPVTFVVSNDGFAAVESELYLGTDLIPWNEVGFFIETNYTFIVYRDSRAIFWLPKRFFPKEVQKELSDFIAQKLGQK
jgi:hypothetical protein